MNCGDEIKRKEKKIKLEYFDDPWATEPHTGVVHSANNIGYGCTCYDALFDSSFADFRYFTCSVCERVVISQCPDNGWRSYKRTEAESGEEICVACWQKNMLENGLKEDELTGDFFNSSDLSLHSWVPVPGGQMFINSKRGQEELGNFVKDLFAKGLKVLIDYNRVAIGGLEGSLTVYSKR
jgi:hypothetical protein